MMRGKEVLSGGVQRVENVVFCRIHQVEQVVLHKVRQAGKVVEDVFRGYSEEDVIRARGLVDGLILITPIDRENFIKGEEERLSTLLIPGPSQALMDPVGFLRTEAFRQYNQRMRELRDSKPEEVDKRIIREAQRIVDVAERAERKHTH